jgi:hypothetical protein
VIAITFAPFVLFCGLLTLPGNFFRVTYQASNS